MRKIALEMVLKNGVLCVIFQSYDLILIDQATGVLYRQKEIVFICHLGVGLQCGVVNGQKA
jgi:hypothetical protein